MFYIVLSEKIKINTSFTTKPNTKVYLCLFFHQEYGGLDGLSMSDVGDLVEQSRDILDDVWRQIDFEPYPESRMIRLMDVIGGTVSHEHKPTLEIENKHLTMSL